jgi:hypothetical protein
MAYCFAPEPLAECVSLKISERRVNAQWEAAKAIHIANGGVVMTHNSSVGEQSYLL